jgi:hypothetical protein
LEVYLSGNFTNKIGSFGVGKEDQEERSKKIFGRFTNFGT